MHVQSFCFVNLNLLLFCRSRSHYRRRCSSVVTRIRIASASCGRNCERPMICEKKRAVSKIFGDRVNVAFPVHTNPDVFETAYFFLLIGLRSAHTKPVPESAPRHRNRIFLKPLSRVDFSTLWSTEIRYIFCVNYVIDT